MGRFSHFPFIDLYIYIILQRSILPLIGQKNYLKLEFIYDIESYQILSYCNFAAMMIIRGMSRLSITHDSQVG